MKNIINIYCTLVVLALVNASCTKEYKATPTFAKFSIAQNWAKPEQFYHPNGQMYVPETDTWRNFIGFSITSEGEPDKLGFANPYVAGRGTSPLNMSSLYSALSLSTTAGTFNITIPKCFQFIPKSEDSSFIGTVVVLEQDVRLITRAGDTLFVRIAPAPTPGTYDTRTGLFEISVRFDERGIGGADGIIRRYRFRS